MSKTNAAFLEQTDTAMDRALKVQKPKRVEVNFHSDTEQEALDITGMIGGTWQPREIFDTRWYEQRLPDGTTLVVFRPKYLREVAR